MRAAALRSHAAGQQRRRRRAAAAAAAAMPPAAEDDAARLYRAVNEANVNLVQQLCSDPGYLDDLLKYRDESGYTPLLHAVVRQGKGAERGRPHLAMWHLSSSPQDAFPRLPASMRPLAGVGQ